MAVPARAQVLAFLGDIKENPEDDTPRLILADWLADHGGRGDVARGEFIRLQCEASRLDPEDPRRGELNRQANSLSESHSRDWLEALGRVDHARSYARGLLTLYLHARSMIPGPPNLAETEAYAWVEGLRFHSARALAVNGLAERSLFHGIRSLDFSRCRMGDEGLEPLEDCVDLASLRELDLEENALTEEGVSVLTRAPYLTRLESLNLRYNRLGLKSVERLAGSELLGRLQSLRLGHNHFGTEPAITLVQSPRLAGLKHLGLGSNRLGDTAVVALAGAAHFSGLWSLELSDNGITDAGVIALAGSPHLAGLKLLDLYDVGFGTDGAVALCESATLRGLKTLRVSRGSLSEPGFARLRDRFGASLEVRGGLTR
jgi:uncharacterized protein (TIGR02996 family)